MDAHGKWHYRLKYTYLGNGIIFIDFRHCFHFFLKKKNWHCIVFKEFCRKVEFLFDINDTLLGMANWQWGRVGPKDGIFAPTSHGFVLSYRRPTSYDVENFTVLSPHLGTPQSPAPFCKIIIIVNMPVTITIFLVKHFLLIKIYSKLWINL